MIYLHDTFSGQLYQGADTANMTGGFWETYNGYTSGGRLVLNSDQNRFVFGNGGEDVVGDLEVTGTVRFDSADTNCAVEVYVGNIYGVYVIASAKIKPGVGVTLSANWLSPTDATFPNTTLGQGVDYPFSFVVRLGKPLVLVLAGTNYTANDLVPGWTSSAIGGPTHQVRFVEGINMVSSTPGASLDFVKVASPSTTPPPDLPPTPSGTWTSFRKCVEV